MGEPYPAETLALPDGGQIRVRAIRPDDASRLQTLVLRLSPQTLYWRTNIPMRELPEADARQLAHVDYDRSMALVAVRGPEENEEIIGVARYAAVDAGQNASAEVAIVVDDAYHRQGLGTLLLQRLAGYARRHGIRAFVAVVSPQNVAVARLIRRSGLKVESRQMGPGERQVRILLDRAQGG